MILTLFPVVQKCNVNEKKCISAETTVNLSMQGIYSSYMDRESFAIKNNMKL